MTYFLGKKPHVPGAVSWRYGDLFDRKKLQQPPLVFGHIWNGTEVPILGNHTCGDCVWATQAHLLQAMQRGVKRSESRFSDDSVIADYSAATGYVPGDDSTDHGTLMADAATYWRKTGIADANGKRNQITAYVDVRLGIDELMQAAFDFGGIAIGVQLPASAMQQFTDGKPFTYDRRSKILGGHAIALVGRNSHGDAVLATWDGITAASMTWLEAYMDEAVAYINLDYLDARGVNPRGFDRTELEKRLAAL